MNKNAIDRHVTAHKLTCATRKEGAAVDIPCTCGFDEVHHTNDLLKLLVEKVEKMRKAQDTYFTGGRLRGDLQIAKAWEKDVDKLIAEIKRKALPATTPQERLL